MSMLVEVRREHWLRFIDLRAGAEVTSALNPTSEIRHAPQMDKVVREGKLFNELAKVDSRM